ncbi:MAG: universal stress protein, partial [Myxococcota bacterium]
PNLARHHDPGHPYPPNALATQVLQPLADYPGIVSHETLEAGSAEEGLRQAMAQRQAHVLVLGRRAPIGGGVGAIRLGRVARRLVRDLPFVVLVVPPDLQPGQIGSGPVVLANDPTQPSQDAVRWAARVAEVMGRTLTLVHVLPPVDRRPYLPPPVQEEIQAMLHRPEEAFVAWAERSGVGPGVGPIEQVCVEGAPVPALIAAAQARQACMLVTGSRGLDGVQRLYLASVGTELAATAPLPVALVPRADADAPIADH